jgi:hypothetical protein
MLSCSSLALTVGLPQSGFEHRYPTAFAIAAIVCRVKLSRAIYR